MDGVVAYILGKSYTKKSLIGIGALAGAPCEVQSINKVDKTTTVTLKWEDNVGGIHTQSFDIEDGLDGISVVGATINPTGNLILTLSDGNTINCGKVLPQYDTMPTPSSSNVGQVLQYIGTTGVNYTKGYFYECVESPVGSGTYIWQYINVQDSYTKIEIGNLNNLPDNTKNVVENISQLKLSIDQLQASKLSISDIDNTLSNSSENPVQNKIITGALNDKEDKFRVSIMPTATVDNLGKIVQYVGATDSNYTNGYFYQCVEISADVYGWNLKYVQPNGGAGGSGVVDGYYNSTDHLFYEEAGYINPISGDSDTLYVSLDTNLLYRYNGLIFIRVDESTSGEDDVIDGYYNVSDHKFYEEPTYVTEIIGTTGKIYISDDTNVQYRWDGTQFVTISSSIDVDNALSTTSENPVQNKVITLAIQDLQASKLSINDIDNALSTASENPVQNKVITLALNQLQGSLANKVDKEAGKGLSSNDFTTTEKEKLRDLAPVYLIGSGLALNPTDGTLSATGISIQVDPTLDKTSTHPIQNQAVANAIDQLQASKLSISDIDNALSTTSENPVQNKVIALTIDQLQGSVLGKMQKMLSANADNFAIFDNNGQVIDSNISKDVVPSTASASNKLLVASDLSAKADKVSGATDNDIAILDANGNLKDSHKSLSDLQEKLTQGNGIDITSNTISVDTSYLTASRLGFIPTTAKGASNGVAELDSTGKVPSGQLPSYVDDVVEGYLDSGTFYEDAEHTRPITPESGKIYVNLTDNTTYRWSGTVYVQISSSLALGTTHTTAYYGDYGETAYQHSQITNGSNPHNTKANNVNLNVPITMLSGTKLQVEETLDALNSEKADKVSSAVNGDLAGLDTNGNLTDSGILASNVIQKVATATGLLKDDGTVDTTSYAPSSNAYLTTDSLDTSIDNADYVPFYDVSATSKKKIVWTNIKSLLKTYFDGIYATITTVSNKADKVATPTTDDFVVLDSNGNIADSGINKNIIPSGASSSNKLATASDIPDELNDLGDVVISSATLANSQILAYNSTSGKWENQTGQSVVGGATFKGSILFTNLPTTGMLNGDWYDIKDAFTTDNRFEEGTGISCAAGTDVIWVESDSKWNILTPSGVYSFNGRTGAVVPAQSDYDALDIDYDNTSSGLTATDVQNAIDEVASSSTAIKPPVSPTPTESIVVTALTTGTSSSSTEAASAYAVQQWSNSDTKRFTCPISASASGITGIGDWDDSTEADWWQDNAFMLPDSIDSKNIDISFKFDPQVNNGEVVVLGGYILDTTTGKLCIKFANTVYNAQLIAVDITYTRNNYS